MKDRPLRNWLVLLRDAVAVLAGILAAFGLDAWWSTAQSNARVQEALAQIQSEFEYNRPRLREIIERNERQIGATEALHRLTPQTLQNLDSDSLETLMIRSTVAATFDPSLGATNAAIASGVLQVGGMDRVSRALESWQALIDDVQEESEVQIQAFYDFHQANAAAGTLISLVALRDTIGEPAQSIEQLVLAHVRPGILREQHANMALAVHWNTLELRRIEAQLDSVLAIATALRRE